MSESLQNRLGNPSPLIFHISAAVAGYQSAIANVVNPDTAGVVWQPELIEQAATIGELNAPLLQLKSLKRLQEMLSGLHKWQAHPYRRAVMNPPVIWSSGSSRLIDFGSCPEAANPNGPPILVVPSLINRAYILDLNENCSLLRYLAAHGLRPLLLDWGYPSDTEREFDLNSYVTQRLLPAIEVSSALADTPIGVLGYCMGGTLAAGVLSFQNTNVGAFATIGSPWDFAASKGVRASLRAAATESPTSEMIENMGNIFGMIPAEFFQQLFALINPMQAAVKFRKFDNMVMDTPAANHFVAIEDWLADGVPLVTPSAKDVLIDWNLHNSTTNGRWKLQDKVVKLSAIRQPTLNVCGLRDSITQLDVASAMAHEIPNAKLLMPDAGHVGMIVGSKARETVWKPVSEFFLDKL
ncbi:MAG: alpha/beta fold hydrolase [Rhodobacteraceae bacterium]|nr:alpha/beta fold hydrolase [Paracoccaceae bacterium]